MDINNDEQINDKFKKTLESIIQNYKQTEESIVNQLNFQVPNHPPTIGGFREEIWMQLFAQIVPKKYVIEHSVFIIDSHGSISNEVDLAIFDEMYTPYIFRNGRIKFIPIEAVAAVVQCKSQEPCYDNLNNWCESIKNLKTSRNAIARMATGIVTENLGIESGSRQPTQTGTRPIMILCHLGNTWGKENKLFDFELTANKDERHIIIHLNPDNSKLDYWFNLLNHNDKKDKDDIYEDKKLFLDEDQNEKMLYKTNYSLDDYRINGHNKHREVSLLSFNLQLNQLLMLINNPMLFPHMAYAELFNDIYDKMMDKDTK